jgi:hypothetical protein
LFINLKLLYMFELMMLLVHKESKSTNEFTRFFIELGEF